MKLRNKNTRELGFLITKKYSRKGVSTDDLNADVVVITDKKSLYYTSIAELNKEWEDYEEKEPLIKDKKIRKALKAWAEALNIEYVRLDNYGEDCRIVSKISDLGIEFDITMVDLKDGHYTIAELCGEEE